MTSENTEILEILQGLSEKTYYRIGEVAKLTRMKPHVLRFWESEFNVISPSKSRSKQRLYRKKDIEVILMIKQLLYKEGFTIRGARRRLIELGRLERDRHDPVVAAEPPEPEASLGPRSDLAEIRAELEKMRDLLDAP